MTLKTRGGVLVLLLLASISAPQAAARDSERPTFTIGIVYDGPPPDDGSLSLGHFLEVPDRIREETLALTRREYDVRFPADKQITADWSLMRIREGVETLLADPEVDLVLAVGVFASSYVSRRTDFSKPVIAPFAVDVVAQSLPFEDGASGVPNLNYLHRKGNVQQDLRRFKDLTGYDRLHIVVDSLFLELTPESRDYAGRIADALDAEATLIPVDSSAKVALDALDDAEAVYVTPLVRMPSPEFEKLIAGLIERKLPSFSLRGEVEVERGLLACLRRATDTTRLARRVALNIQRILLGEDAGNLPVIIDQPEKLLINIETAKSIGYYPRWRVTLEADLIGTDNPWGHEPTAPSLKLSEAVLEAVASNLSLRATDRQVAAGAQNVRLARSSLLPQVDASALGLRIDEDRAVASFGSQAETTVTAGLSASQLIVADQARSRRDIARHAQRALEHDRETSRLAVALDASTAFLDVLRAETLERIEVDNMRLTESNLELARRREAVGFSGLADVYRWESQLATDRSNVIKAHNRVHTALIFLNRTLHRPLEQTYHPTPPRLENPELITGFGRLSPYIDNPAGFEVFREFSVKEGLAKSPELAVTDTLIDAEKRNLLATKRSFWMPEVALVGLAERRVSQAGDSTAGSFTGIPGADRNDWSLSLQGTLPLFSGGSRRAASRQSSEELSRLRIERRALAESVELRIRVALWEVGGTFPAIGLAQEAAEAARKNLELVTDSYSRGVVSIIDLLDAQNAAQVAEAFAANAVYDFLIDLMELQRSTNDFDFFRSEQGRNDWFDRLDVFFDEAGYIVRRPAR